MILLAFFIATAAAVIGIGSVYFFHLKPDNPIEQVAEEVIKDETGVTIDLSPDSQEEKK